MKEIRVLVPEEVHSALSGIAERRVESLADVVRRYLSESVSKDAAEDGLDYLLVELRRTLQDVLKPHINRLAALNAKTATTSGTAMYMTLEALSGLGVKDVVNKYEKARMKAVANLKAKESDVVE